MRDDVKMIHFWRGWRAGALVGFAIGVLFMAWLVAVTS